MDHENPPNRPMEYELNLRLVDAGTVASGHATSTDDECGSGDTGSQACTTTSD